MKHTVIILFICLLSSCSIFIGESRETSVLYRWEVAEKVFVWKYIGNEEINPKYKGEIKDNQPDGMGITIFPDGYRHSGQYKDFFVNQSFQNSNKENKKTKWIKDR